MTRRKEYTVEFIINATPAMLYNLISTPAGLSQWFADNAVSEERIYTFTWEGTTEKARLERAQKNKIVKFRWIEREEKEFLTMEIVEDDLTHDLALVVTDHDNEEEIEEARKVWESSVEQLKASIGA